MYSQLTSLPMCGFIAQLVEHRTGIAEVTGSNPVEALIFFRRLYSNCLNWKFTAKITYHLHIPSISATSAMGYCAMGTAAEKATRCWLSQEVGSIVC